VRACIVENSDQSVESTLFGRRMRTGNPKIWNGLEAGRAQVSKSAGKGRRGGKLLNFRAADWCIFRGVLIWDDSEVGEIEKCSTWNISRVGQVPKMFHVEQT
jgi:hypothetical protein